MPSDTEARRKTRLSRSLPLLGVTLAVVLLVGGLSVWLFGGAAPSQQQVTIGGPFQLVNSQDQPVTAKSFAGKLMLVYFGYTYCPDVCPTTLNNVSVALDKLGKAADGIAPLFITVDPARDTPAVIGQYTAAFSPRIEGLTGTPEQIKAVAAEYRVYYAKHVTGPGPNDYSMDHSSILYVMRPNGHFAGIIRADETPDALAADLEKYLS